MSRLNRRPCRFFLQGHCRFGDRCRFAHPLSDEPTPTTTTSMQPPRVCAESGCKRFTNRRFCSACADARKTNQLQPHDLTRCARCNRELRKDEREVCQKCDRFLKTTLTPRVRHAPPARPPLQYPPQQQDEAYDPSNPGLGFPYAPAPVPPPVVWPTTYPTQPPPQQPYTPTSPSYHEAPTGWTPCSPSYQPSYEQTYEQPSFMPSQTYSGETYPAYGTGRGSAVGRQWLEEQKF